MFSLFAIICEFHFMCIQNSLILARASADATMMTVCPMNVSGLILLVYFGII